MSSLAEIEEAVSKLPPEEFSLLLRKMQERAAADWDCEMEEDARSGRLGALHTRLALESADEPEVPLDDFLDDGQLPKAV